MSINVKSAPWNAAGNGANDDYNAIQSAINAVGALGGGTILCPSGKYSISQALTWTAPDVYLVGDGAATIVPRPKFTGAAAIVIGEASAVLTPTYRGGIENMTVDLSQNTSPDLVGVKLIQAWFSHIDLLRISNPNGLAVPIQRAFVIDAGTLAGGLPGSTWSANNNIYDLQIGGSFAVAIQHMAVNGGMVNGTNYFGGFAFGVPGHPSTYAFRIEQMAGDSTRMSGTAFEDWGTGVYVASPNNGPFDPRFENCMVKYEVAPGITLTVPVTSVMPQ